MAIKCVVRAAVRSAAVLTRNQDAFEANWRLLGRAKIPFDFESDEQSNSGVSTQVRGACSIANRGVSEFFPHDKVKWRLPSLDKETRIAEGKEIHTIEVRTRAGVDGAALTHFQGSPKHKLLPILEPVTYADIYKMPQRAFERYRKVAGEQGGASKIATRNVGPRPVGQPDALTRFAIGYMRAAGLMKAFAAIAVLAERGVITINLDGAAPENVAGYEDALASQAGIDLRARPADAARAKSLTSLAYMLDLIEPRFRDVHLKPSEPLINDILLAQNRGLVDDTSADYAALSRFLGVKASDAQAQAKSSAEAQLNLMQVNAVRRETELFATTKNNEDEKIVGIALSHAFPGEMLDILL